MTGTFLGAITISQFFIREEEGKGLIVWFRQFFFIPCLERISVFLVRLLSL